MISRGWSDDDLIGLMGGNMMRVMDQVDNVAESMEHVEASRAVYEKREDLPATGPEWMAYLPEVVREYLENRKSTV